MKKKILLLISLLVLITYFVFIQNKTTKPLSISFYHWENSFKEEGIKDKLYIKILDISYSTKLEIITTNMKEIPKDFIPVIYITNETLKNVDFILLSDTIIKKLTSYNFDELQIDCDWSIDTKSNYFKLLENLKNKCLKEGIIRKIN